MVDTTNVTRLMEKMHVKKKDLAIPLGTTPQNVSFKFNGKNHFSLGEIKILCNVLQIDTGEIFDYFVVKED